MREKKPALIATFATTTAAMAAECFCLTQALPGRLIPVPREITAGCGLAWKAPPEEAERLADAWRAAGISWSEMRVLEL